MPRNKEQVKRRPLSFDPAEIPVKICHYGTGKYKNSPVVLIIPRELDLVEERVPLPFFQALAFRTVFQQMEDSEDLTEVRHVLSWVRSDVAGGRYSRASIHMDDAIRYWRNQGMGEYPMLPAKPTPEDSIQDRLGWLALADDFDKPAGDTSLLDSSSLYSWTAMSKGSLAYGIASSAAVATAAGVTAANAADPMTAVFCLFGLFLVRFTRPIGRIVYPSNLRTKALELMVEVYERGEGKQNKRDLWRFRQFLASGASHEEIFQRVAEVLHEREVVREDERLQELIEEEFAALTAVEEPEVAPVVPPMVALLMDEVETREWALIKARRALLADLTAAREAAA